MGMACHEYESDFLEMQLQSCIRAMKPVTSTQPSGFTLCSFRVNAHEMMLCAINGT